MLNWYLTCKTYEHTQKEEKLNARPNMIFI